MKGEIKTAVILAAGLGSRLANVFAEPKSFIKIQDETLIERSIRLLIDQGISNIIIGTGYKAKHFEVLKPHYPQIVTSINADYRHSGSMYTLYLLKDLIKDPFLLLESDLLYERRSLEHLLEDERENIILGSGPTQSGDEFFIEASSQGYLIHLSKNKMDIAQVSGELVGISKISLETLATMCSFAEQFYRAGNRQIIYEDAMVGVAKDLKLWVKVVQDLVWCEIDDENHLKRAQDLIYPKILERD